MNKNSQVILDALAPTLAGMSTIQSSIVRLIVERGPIRGSTIDAEMGRAPGFSTGHVKAIRWNIREVAKIDAVNQHGKGTSGGYALRLLPGVKPKTSTGVAVPPSPVAPEPEAPTQATKREPSDAQPNTKRTRERRLYSCPWPGGTFDLDEVVSVSLSQQGQLVLQLNHGSFVRGPVHDDSAAVAEDIERVLAQLRPNTTYSFRERARSGEAFPNAVRPNA